MVQNSSNRVNYVINPVYMYPDPDLRLYFLTTQLTGVINTNYTYMSVFNPVGSGVTIIGEALSIQPYALGGTSTTDSFMGIRRITSHTGGVEITSNIMKGNPLQSDSIATARSTGSIVTLDGIFGAIGPILTGGNSVSNPELFQFPMPLGRVVFPEGYGLALQMAEASDVDIRWLVTLRWFEVETAKLL